MSATADVARMLTLVPWFIERPGATLAEAGEAFGVPSAVIRRDLGHLDFCGLPGLGGGDLFDVSLVGERVVIAMADELKRPLRPTPDEALRLVLTVDAVVGALGGELPALRSAIGKVRSALGIPEDVADVLEDEDGGFREDLLDAVRTAKRVRLRYQGRADEVPLTREVDPWTLHVLDGVWYLQGHDHRAAQGRIFRLDRLSDVEVLDEDATVDAPDELAVPRYEPAADDPEVVLRVTAAGRWVQGAIDVDHAEEHDDGSATLTLRTDAPRFVARLVLMAGGEATIISPPSIRAEVVRLATEAIDGARVLREEGAAPDQEA